MARGLQHSRGRLAALTLLLLLLPALAERAGGRSVIVDLDGDGAVEEVRFEPTADPTVRVLRESAVLWVGVPRALRPWKLATADVEGDGMREIVVGLHKETPYMPFPHNCLYVYGWDGTQGFPKWRGSALSHPFTDFALADIDGDGSDELISVETDLDRSQCVMVYDWSGFGFAGEALPQRWRTVRLLGADRCSVRLEADGRTMTIGGGAP